MGADQSTPRNAEFPTVSDKNNANKKRARSPGGLGTSGRLRRSSSATPSVKSELSVGDWGFFEEFENKTPPTKFNSRDSREDDFEEKKLIVRALSLPPPATQPPMYVLESTLQTQHLWYLTAGMRPKQPAQEREYFERLWRQNFDNSSVQYKEGEKDEKATIITSAPSSSSAGQLISSPNSSALTFNQGSSQNPTHNKSGKSHLRDEVPYKEFDGEILYRGKGPFSNSVTRSFPEHDISGMTLQVPRFRIVRTNDGEVHAEFLVVISINSHHSFTFGLWKRHSDFHKLSVTVQVCEVIYYIFMFLYRSHSLNCLIITSFYAWTWTLQAIETYGRNRDHNSGISFKNALLSWQCLIHRKRWFRCLDKVGLVCLIDVFDMIHFYPSCFNFSSTFRCLFSLNIFFVSQDYLSLKCFLLERFMHDLLFESHNPVLISDFLGL